MEEVPRPGESVGRYVIERVLGSGGMGVVLAAHDPDLDRRVAVKLLHARGPDQAEARPRLLREARAMAKLSHPNVITVHEVGTDGDRDFVAMELIDGQNVAEWLARPRAPAEVMRVMLAAGHGLAAAHAAGLVHRDFKPHNVLISSAGRVVVTDFGLARAFDELDAAPTVPILPDDAIALDETMDATPAARTQPSLSGTLTRTGALLGTPAYMAPEQFAGEPAGPAADQFAFAVTLWEGLAGARPFLGGTLIELQRAVESGVVQGGATIPRRFRRVLERALAREPAARWPSMDAMLAALETAVRAPRRNASIGAGVALLGGAVACFFLLDRPGASGRATACPPAERRLAAAWPPAASEQLDAHFGAAPGWSTARAGLHDFRGRWTTSWQAVCAAPDEPHFHSRVACLEGALDELAGLVSILGEAPPDMLRGIELSSILPPPDGCLDNTRVGFPQLPDDPALRDEVARIHRELAVARILAHGGRGDDARAKVESALAAATAVRDRYLPIHAEALEAKATVHEILGDVAVAEPLYEEAAEEAEEAGHLPVRAMSMLGQLSLLTRRSSDGALIRKLADQTRAAIKRAGDDPVLLAGVDSQLAELMAREGDLDGAIDRAEAARQVMARAGDVRRAGVAALSEVQDLIRRSDPGDAERAQTLLHDALLATAPVFGDGHPVTQRLLIAMAWLRWHGGDVAGAHQLFAAVVHEPPGPPDDAVHVRGQVIDGSGAPVSGAVVRGGRRLVGDPSSVVLPDGLLPGAATWAATTGADGRFELDLPAGSILLAQSGGDLAAPVPAGDDVVLTLRAPARIGGTLQVTGVVAGDDRASALARHLAARRVVLTTLAGPVGRFQLMAPVSAHDRWAMVDVPPGAYLAVADVTTALGDYVQTSQRVEVTPGGEVLMDLAVDRSGVLLDVVVRTDRLASIPSAEVHVIPGSHATGSLPISKLADFLADARAQHVAVAGPVSVADETEPGRAVYQPGDIHARLSSVAPGPITVCVIPLAGDAADEAFLGRLMANPGGLEMTCVEATITAVAGIQVVPVQTEPARRMP